MKKVIDVSIGGIKFSMGDDAYLKLKNYLTCFENTIPDKQEAMEVMEDVEARVAEILQKELKYPNQVVENELVQVVINHLGEVEPSNEKAEQRYRETSDNFEKGEKRLYRNTDEKVIAGVCSGLSDYFNIDVTIVRILFAVSIIFWGTTCVAYVILWLVIPKAVTVIQKLKMKGYATTAENIRRYNTQYKN